MAKKKETADQEQFRLEEAFDRIEALLEKLQDKDVTLEESFGLYQEGMGLLKLCNENIDHVEKQMLQIDEEGQTHEFS
ncbi:MAG: exodeoxyribonuclease VII small subunit [Clostridiaceae bacterium]|jgi:exodeoxyribonuclease VII small subunit|uniref:Exodeoxyribonuclease 7 small subunit n=1 Tax=Hominiventricola aquisgranensis TaxID=3133164 RepID=A0ABV1HYE7_9FIRM|nr:exodeoxyribonuclease VII small subunit [Clostridiaceae bacterium]MDY4547507.1 exodeoxyribonuclease VII small subunit [Candidatus Choladocola sp.]RGD95104.1 exodeoxyribonuclease VII small subunit [Clostridiales bacterium AM23-16LB]RHR46949.1 exodeoxyribonuclease VII small subunit [Clostridiaceae bacterium AF18-31LB]RHT83181.1 exodeoxyribonuclease VII small subunit [Clostridiaceae bacterium AM27-36LB]RHW05340.1 exodeoxyribonuclease VII small subunit [Clostridiaceae bacterium OF09-1]